ncbi:hypothetical protein EJ08DRAFT_738700 [Tothia fuscella]|uniref:Uncharacterized protein n=1 Tax=Tothia fuscella TaxID=1048955 RepID=A0A9P4NG06_9PEZI|nr:hypothetical protein EJ08DRAFT_738700 [Tothia fuscella]
MTNKHKPAKGKAGKATDSQQSPHTIHNEEQEHIDYGDQELDTQNLENVDRDWEADEGDEETLVNEPYGYRGAIDNGNDSDEEYDQNEDDREDHEYEGDWSDNWAGNVGGEEVEIEEWGDDDVRDHLNRAYGWCGTRAEGSEEEKEDDQHGTCKENDEDGYWDATSG